MYINIIIALQHCDHHLARCPGASRTDTATVPCTL